MDYSKIALAFEKKIGQILKMPDFDQRYCNEPDFRNEVSQTLKVYDLAAFNSFATLDGKQAYLLRMRANANKNRMRTPEPYKAGEYDAFERHVLEYLSLSDESFSERYARDEHFRLCVNSAVIHHNSALRELGGKGLLAYRARFDKNMEKLAQKIKNART